jgi:hypothetical protein
VDTNVFQLSMKCLQAKDVQLATGDVVKCRGCQVVLNLYSNIKDTDEGKQEWKCEFCNVDNYISVEPEEKPQKETVSYILEAAPQKKQETPTTEAEEVKGSEEP